MKEETNKKPERKSNDRDYILGVYLQEIAQYPLLTREQEIEIGRKSFRGDEEARKLMTNSNLRLVVKIARNYENRGLSLMDLIQEGNRILMKAVIRYNPDFKSKKTKKPVKFSSYVWRGIEKEIKRELCYQGKDISVPARKNHSGMSFVYLDAQTDEIGEKHSGLGEEMHQHLPSDEPTPYDKAEKRDRANLVRNALNYLNEKERRIIEMRFGLNGNPEMSLEEIGRTYGVTRQRIEQIEKLAKKRLSVKLNKIR